MRILYVLSQDHHSWLLFAEDLGVCRTRVRTSGAGQADERSGTINGR